MKKRTLLAIGIILTLAVLLCALVMNRIVYRAFSGTILQGTHAAQGRGTR